MKDLEKLAGEDFEGTWPFEARYKTIQGFRMHYVDEGSGEPIVLLHGEPTWGYLYRNFIPPLAQGRRVVVPDHMGLGKSEVSRDKQYVLSQHIHNLADLLLELDLTDITLVMQDWGGPIGFGFATHYPERIKRLVILNTALGVMREGSHTWITSMREQGLYDDFMGNLRANIGLLMAGGTVHNEFLTGAVLQAYQAPFPDRESCAGAMAFPLDIPVGEHHPSTATMRAILSKLPSLESKPKILIWGRKDVVFGEAAFNSWQQHWPGIETRELPEAGHFLQEDAPDEIVGIIQDFLKAHP